MPHIVKKYKYAIPRDYFIPIQLNGKKYYLLINCGFIWDGCSGVKDDCEVASCLHDFLYTINPMADNHYIVVADSLNNLKELNLTTIKISRRDADKIYVQYIKNPFRKIIRYIGVRILGKLFYQKQKRIFIDIKKGYVYRECKYGVIVYYHEDIKNGIINQEIFRYVNLKKV
jgi:hypothetical protein